MATISSGQVMAWPVSASTRAAAANALGFGACGVGLLAGAGATALVLPAWAGGVLGACFFLAFMELLLGEGIGTHRQRACRAARMESAQLPRRAPRDQAQPARNSVFSA